LVALSGADARALNLAEDEFEVVDSENLDDSI
jgi:hypothetical protein